MQSESSRKMLYTGPSMNPILKEPDFLYVTPYTGQEIKRGDVIVFKIPGSERKATHRVISITESGITTRGDRNPRSDPYLLQSDDIIGIVYYIQRGRKIKRLHGGSLGYFHGLFRRIHIIRSIDKTISSLLFPIYDSLSHSGLFKKVLSGRLKLRIFSFEAPGGTELKLYSGRLAIGYRPAGQKKWRICRPFRLFIDETALPD